MLRKLLKYDLQYIFKFLIIFYSLAVFFGLLTRIFFSFENSLVLEVLGEISTGATISMMCSIIINNLMRMWVRFSYNFYGDESYLTHTLPIEKRTHYFSKIITSVIALFTSIAIVGGVIVLAYYSKENLALLKSILLPVANAYDTSIVSILVAFMFILFLQFLNILQCGFTGIILGHKMNSAKTGLSVFFGFVTYMISQIFAMAIIFIVGLFDDKVMNLFKTTTMVDIATIKMIIYLAIGIYTVLSIVICAVNIYLFKKGVDID